MGKNLKFNGKKIWNLMEKNLGIFRAKNLKFNGKKSEIFKEKNPKFSGKNNRKKLMGKKSEI